MTIVADFSSARAKLDRARKHIADVESGISAYLATNFYKFGVQIDKGANELKVVFESLHEPDQTLNAIIGDAIGNLRSVLDYAVIAMLFPITGERNSGGFPFADDANGFDGQTKALLAPLGQTAVDHFLGLQGYDGGAGKTFWALNKLRNIDKHRLLVATARLAGIRASFRSSGVVFSNCTFMVRAGEQVNIFRAPAQGAVQFTDKPTPIFAVQLREPPYVQDVPVVPFLKKALGETETFLNALEVVCGK